MVVAFLKKNPWGRYNGYVAFKEKLPLSIQGGCDYENEPMLDEYIDIHGGITFDAHINMDTPIIPITTIPEDFYFYRVVGFDTCHTLDMVEDWTFEKVKNETLKLKSQIEKLIKSYENKKD